MKTPTNNIIPQGYKMTELGALPEEWEVVKLGEIMVPDRTKLKREDYKGDIPMVEKIYFDTGKIAIRGQRKTNTDIYIADKDRIITSKINFHQGAVAITYSLVAATTHYEFYKVLEKADIMYLWRYLRSEEFKYIFSQEIKFRGFKKEANFNFVKDFKIPLPPLAEQQKIAAVLSAVQEAKEKTEAVIAATKALKQSMMKHLFTYGPVSPEEVEKVPLKETEIGPVPEDWEVMKLDNEYIEFKNGLWKGKKEPYIKVKVLRNTNFNNDGTINFKDVAELDVEEKSFKYREIIKGDIILERSGGGPTQPVGRVVFFEKSDQFRYSFSNFTSRIRVVNELKIFPKFLFYFLFYFYYQGKTNDIQNRTTGIRNLDFSKYKQIQIPLPPLPTQQKIASILSAIDEKIEAEENKKKALEELFKSLLHNLMTAKIRVNHLEIIS